jgi:hypothetical protein
MIERKSRERLPNRRGGIAFDFDYEGFRYTAMVSRFADGRLAEIFLDVGKAGTPVRINAEAAAILTSLCLQHGVPAETIRHAVNGPVAAALDRCLGQSAP